MIRLSRAKSLNLLLIWLFTHYVCVDSGSLYTTSLWNFRLRRSQRCWCVPTRQRSRQAEPNVLLHACFIETKVAVAV